MSQANAQDKVSKAKINLLLDHPFFGVLSTHLELVCDSSVETLATDGEKIFYNPEFVLGRETSSLTVIVAHELAHVALGHPLRRRNRDLNRWNAAADHVVNNLLKSSGFEEQPDWLCDEQYAGMSVEEVYDLLPEDAGKGKGCGCGMIDPNDAPQQAGAQTQAEQREVLAKMEQLLAQASISGELAGTLPGAMQEALTASREHVVDWRAILNEFCEQTSHNDFSWSPPNRRFAHQGIILPSVRSKQMGTLVVALDTSASIDNEALSRFADELSAILSETCPENIYVLHVDTAVQHVDEFSVADLPLTMAAKGRGGTDVKPAFAWVEQQGIDPTCLIYFTDMQFWEYPDEPDYPTLWVSPQQIQARYAPKFGQHLAMTSNH